MRRTESNERPKTPGVDQFAKSWLSNEINSWESQYLDKEIPLTVEERRIREEAFEAIWQIPIKVEQSAFTGIFRSRLYEVDVAGKSSVDGSNPPVEMRPYNMIKEFCRGLGLPIIEWQELRHDRPEGQYVTNEIELKRGIDVDLSKVGAILELGEQLNRRSQQSFLNLTDGGQLPS